MGCNRACRWASIEPVGGPWALPIIVLHGPPIFSPPTIPRKSVGISDLMSPRQNSLSLLNLFLLFLVSGKDITSHMLLRPLFLQSHLRYPLLTKPYSSTSQVKSIHICSLLLFSIVTLLLTLPKNPFLPLGKGNVCNFISPFDIYS